MNIDNLKKGLEIKTEIDRSRGKLEKIEYAKSLTPGDESAFYFSMWGRNKDGQNCKVEFEAKYSYLKHSIKPFLLLVQAELEEHLAKIEKEFEAM